jgi:membrane-bound ClpP family serine protease
LFYLRLLRQFITSRSRKRRAHLPAVFSTAIVNTDLNPRGSVIARGELWNAESKHGTWIPERARVTIVGFRNHFLLVEERS